MSFSDWSRRPGKMLKTWATCGLTPLAISIPQHYHAGTQTCFMHTDVTEDRGDGFGYAQTFACDTAFCSFKCTGFSYTCTVNAGTSVQAISFTASGSGSLVPGRPLYSDGASGHYTRYTTPRHTCLVLGPGAPPSILSGLRFSPIRSLVCLPSKKERKETDTPNEGWDEDRVPACRASSTARVLNSF